MQLGLQFLFSLFTFFFGNHHTLLHSVHGVMVTQTITIAPSPSSVQTKSPIISLSPTSIEQQNSPQTSSSLSDFIYPNHANLQNNSGSSTFESTDSPTTIVNWYKNLFSQKNMHTTSIVQTSTNGNVEDKLAAAGNGISLAIEITKNANQSMTTVTLHGTNNTNADVEVHVDNKTY